MMHGGARPGAGRKAIAPEDRRVQLGARVKPEVKDWLVKEAEMCGTTVGRVLEEMARYFMEQD